MFVHRRERTSCMYLYNFAGSTGDQHFLQVVAYVSLSTSSRVQAGSQRQGSKRKRQSVYCALLASWRMPTRKLNRQILLSGLVLLVACHRIFLPQHAARHGQQKK